MYYTARCVALSSNNREKRVLLKRGKGLRPLLALVILLASSALLAETKITGLQINSLSNPVFSPSRKGGGTSDAWAAVELDYELGGSKETWTDNVEIRWLVVVPSSGQKKYACMSRILKYRDIELGQQHHAMVLINPRFFRRHAAGHRLDTNTMSAYVEVYVDGKLVAKKDRRANGMPKGDWWMKTDRMQRFEGTLLPRFKTPFSVLDTLYYDAEIENEKGK